MMGSQVESRYSNRFVVEDSITRVTTDGEPHGMMTMIAVLSGMATAAVILAILVFYISCKKNKRTQPCANCPSLSQRGSNATTNIAPTESARSSISTNYTRRSNSTNTEELNTTISIISRGNLGGNLNSAFEGSELTLNDSLPKKKNKKRTHWSDEVQRTHGNDETMQETTIDIERF